MNILQNQLSVRKALTVIMIALCATTAVAIFKAQASAAVIDTNYYVSTSGKDSNNGRSSTPWRTIQKAAATAPAGSTINVRAGTYDPFTVSKAQVFTNSGTGTVLVKGKAGVQDVVRISASDVTLTGMTVYGCVPNQYPVGGPEENGSSGVRINDGASNVTVKNMIIRDSTAVNSYRLAFGCYGIFAHKADNSIISGNNIYGNGAGIYLTGGGKSTQITNNQIHDNNVLIRNTPGNNDDFGASAVTFNGVSALPGPTATLNNMYNNAGPSSDYGADGGGFEIYNSSNITMANNTQSNNENILETGTFAGGDCVNNRYTGNTVVGKTAGSKLDKSVGMILRCAKNMVIDSNKFTEIDWWVYVIDVDSFSGTVAGLTITNNQISQWQKVYHLGVDPVANGMTINNNRFHFTGPIFSSYADGTTSPSLADWQLRSGLDAQSTTY